MKRVSFEVAKALKEAGYPQWSVEEADNSKLAYDCEGELWEIRYFDQNPQDYYTAPTYLDVWLWLWREKDMKLLFYPTYKEDSYGIQGLSIPFNKEEYNDPEEAIIAAIEYFVNKDLIK